MKILAKLEKNKTFWYLLVTSLIFFFLRLPSLIEPNWYGDEGIYQVIGQSLSKGRILYTQIWDNKPPLLYIVYALFSGDQFQVRLFSLLVGLVTTLTFFFLSKKLFKQPEASIIATAPFALLFATPLLEGNIANAENFMLLPIIIAGFLIYKLSIKNYTLYAIRYTLITAGFLLGLAFLFKIVAIFDTAAFILFLFIASFPNDLSLRKNLLRFARNDAIPFATGFVAPLIITVLYFILNHALKDFTQAVFFSNVGYVGYGNKLLIPQGLLILKLTLLSAAVLFIFWKRKQITKPIMFITIWFAFSLFNTFFSGRPYTHYTLVLLPSFCLLLGLIFTINKPRIKFIIFLILLCGGILLCRIFKPNIKKSFLYYGNVLSFVRNTKSVNDYQSFFDQKTPRDYQIASFIKMHTKTTDNIFIWGDSAQIYALSDKQPIGRYTVAYHINQARFGFDETKSAINALKPKYIVTLKESRAIPFYLPMYENKFIFKGTNIYERTY